MDINSIADDQSYVIPVGEIQTVGQFKGTIWLKLDPLKQQSSHVGDASFLERQSPLEELKLITPIFIKL